MRVALTFDAEHPGRPRCPSGNAELILDRLASERVPATFFLQGRWVLAYPELARRIADDGHLVGSHSLNHAPLTWHTELGIARDVLEARDVILSVAGEESRPWFRCPYGDGHASRMVARVLHENGYRHVGWDVESNDWQPAESPASIVRTICSGVGPGRGVVILHIWPESTAQALGSIVERLGEMGAEFVTIDKLEVGESRAGLDPYRFPL